MNYWPGEETAVTRRSQLSVSSTNVKLGIKAELIFNLALISPKLFELRMQLEITPSENSVTKIKFQWPKGKI